MIRFARLYDEIDATTSTNAKVAAMARYFAEAPPADAAWAVFFLTGRRLKRLVPYRSLNDWALAATGLPPWLLQESYAVVGDAAETIALILDQLPPAGSPERLALAPWVEERVMRLRGLEPEAQRDRVMEWWAPLDRLQRFVLMKIITGEFRVGVSQTLVVRALAHAAGLPPAAVAARLMGDWTPAGDWFVSLLATDPGPLDRSRPYPFYLASPLDADLQALGGLAAWIVEWKWDGIRAQLVRRDAAVHLWSRGEEIITRRFPEISAAATHLPEGTVLDGEVLAFRDGRPMPFSALQGRIGREAQVAQMARTVPVVFMAYDLLEDGGMDIRHLPLAERRRRLIELVDAGAPAAGAETRPGVLRVSETVRAARWEDIEAARRDARERGVEGLMLKRAASAYGTGRRRGDWWKWKVDPYSADAVLMYAQPGSGKRASLLTDYTFGVWDQGELVPIAKAYSGLSNDEIAELDRWIRRHTTERFGPVRHVAPMHVFELGFEGIARSPRHRAGIAVRFPRMLRWRKDKKPEEADTLETMRRLLASVEDRHTS